MSTRDPQTGLSPGQRRANARETMKDDTKQLLDFMVMMACCPYKFYMGRPDPKTGKHGRTIATAWMFSVDNDLDSRASFCVYAPTCEEVIRKAKRTYEVMLKAAQMIERAKR